MELQPILHVWIHPDNDLVDLTITSTTLAKRGHPAQQTSEVVHTNQKHPFLTIEKGFLPVGQIKVGMHVVKADGSIGVITGWKSVSGTQVMYNLEVAHDHTFTVGEGMWVVHNCGGNNIPWSSNAVKQAAQQLDAGEKDVTVASRSDAEELFLRKYQGEGYRNTTDMSGPEAKDFFGSKQETYHWDDTLDSAGRVQGHGADNPDGALPHLQIHPFEGGKNIHIFYRGAW